MDEPVLSGEITADGVISLLAAIEELRTSGVLHFEAGDVAGDIELVAGQLALEQDEMPDGRDPVEVLLTLRDGRYDLFQRLPPLPVSKGDEGLREGSLVVHVPADLMNYCEGAGLTGKLRLENDGRSAEAIYDRGELTAIRVDGTEDADLHDVFSWGQGSFEIAAYSQPPKLDVEQLSSADDEIEDPEDELEREPTIRFERRRKQDTSEIFLRSVEVALSDILSEREKRRDPTRTPPPMPPTRKARESSVPGVEKVVRIHATKKRKRQPTVRIVYASNRDPAEVMGGTTRHVGKGPGGSENAVLPEASPDRKGEIEAPAVVANAGGPDEMSKNKRKKKKSKKVRRKPGAAAMKVVSTGSEDAAKPAAAEKRKALAGSTERSGGGYQTLLWVAAVFALLLASLAILARLPPLG